MAAMAAAPLHLEASARGGPATAPPPPPLDPAAVLRGHVADVTALAFHPSGAALLAGDASGELKIWDLAHRAPAVTARVHSEHAGVLAGTFWGPDRLLTQGRDGVVRAWALRPEGRLSEEPLWEAASGSHNFTRLSLLDGGSHQVKFPTVPKCSPMSGKKVCAGLHPDD